MKIDAEDRYHVIPALDPAKTDWHFVEVWIDTLLFRPTLLLMGESRQLPCTRSG
jgi:hypothetical protein